MATDEEHGSGSDKIGFITKEEERLFRQNDIKPGPWCILYYLPMDLPPEVITPFLPADIHVSPVQ